MSRRFLDLLGEHADHAFVLWLTRYSPESNLIAGLWGYVKRSALNNYFFGTVESQEKALHETFENLHQNPERTLAYKCDTELRNAAK